MKDLRGVGRSRDGAVTVTATPSGAVLGLQLAPAAMGRSHVALQQEILDAIRAATQDAARQLDAALAPIPGDRLEQFKQGMAASGVEPIMPSAPPPAGQPQATPPQFGQLAAPATGPRFGQLAELLEQARVDDQCFGPIGGAVGLSSGYFSSLDECRQLANDAKDFLEQTGEQLRDSFEVYRGVDDGISQALTQIGGGLGGGR